MQPQPTQPAWFLSTLLWLGVLGAGATAQEEAGGLPYSSLHPLEQAFESRLLPGPGARGLGAPLGWTPASAGTWLELKGGARLWRLRIEAPGADAMALDFRHLSLARGAVLFVYDDPKRELHGGFGPEHQDPGGGLSIHPIPASALTLELFEPAGTRQPSVLMLERVELQPSLDLYRSLGLAAGSEPQGPAPLELKAQEPRKRGESASCHVDVVCEPGLRWKTLSRSIVKIEGVQNCTGVLINNTTGDGTPYVLTAQHCGSLKLANFWFAWQREKCGQPLVPGEQSFASIFGSALMVESRAHDFQLVRLSATPAPELKAFYAGWDRRDQQWQGGTTLHHPWGDVMKISVERQKLIMQGTNWKIRRWDIGITESGSSGAPLFNQEQRVVGQLKGGPATCQTPRGDLFGRLAPEWELLAPFLDPLGSGVEFLDGAELDPAQRKLTLQGFGKPVLGPDESALVLHGTGFHKHPRVHIDGQRIPGARARWVSNSRILLEWSALEPGPHTLRVGEGDAAVELAFQVGAVEEAPAEERSDESP